jgi:trans-feruloyl-CoA hydratase/vanillin synthase
MAEEQAVRAEEDTVAVTIENRIAWVRFNRPESATA